MSPMIAMMVLTWVAILVLFFALGALWRELRLVRGLAVQGSGDGYVSTAVDISFTSALGGGGEPRIVVAADSGCPLCLAVIDRLSQTPAGDTAVLLTHEDPAVWAGRSGRLHIVSDREAWRAVSHLAPPVLMLVAGNGAVRRLVLPVSELEIDRVLADWSRRGGGEETTNSSEEVRHDAHVG